LAALEANDKHSAHETVSGHLYEAALPAQKRSAKAHRWLRYSGTALLYLLSAYALLRLFADISNSLSRPVHSHQPSAAERRDACSCGDTLEEAMSQGCRYDELEAAWLPDHCRDDELSREFSLLGHKADNTWHYWNDSEHTKELTLQEVSQHVGSPVYITWEWHALHCLYSWRKSYRSRVTGILSDPVHDTEEHSIHCGKILMDRSFGDAALLIS